MHTESLRKNGQFDDDSEESDDNLVPFEDYQKRKSARHLGSSGVKQALRQ